MRAYNRSMDRETQLFAGAMGGLAPIVVAGALVGVRGEILASTVALLLMVVVVAVAAVGGRGAGAIAALTAALSFDFFHTRPYLSLSIVSRDDVETAALLLVAGLIVGTLAGRSGRARQSAAASKSEIRRIHRLAELVASGESPIDVISACQAELTALLELRACHFEAPPFDLSLPRLERSGGISGASARDAGRHRYRDDRRRRQRVLLGGRPAIARVAPGPGRGQRLPGLRGDLDPSRSLSAALDR